jgi:hypothetical protein
MSLLNFVFFTECLRSFCTRQKTIDKYFIGKKLFAESFLRALNKYFDEYKKTLGKELFAESFLQTLNKYFVEYKKHSAKKITQPKREALCQVFFFTERLCLALSKKKSSLQCFLLPSVLFLTLDKKFIPSV